MDQAQDNLEPQSRPRQGFWGLWNISFGFFGIQIGFALQNANMSRIFQSLGESLDDLALLWIAAPLTGLLVQPIIGHYSDRTWCRFGRRRPYFFAGALFAALALVGMPNAPGLLAAAMMLWVLDASLNVSMEPFRAFVGDMLAKEQHMAGYALQTAFIGAGAVIGSSTPWLLDKLGVANVASGSGIPDTVRISFYIGGAALFLAVLWTVLTTREYSPEQMTRFEPSEGKPVAERDAVPAIPPGGTLWIVAGLAVVAIVRIRSLEKELYLLGALLAGYGAARMLARRLHRGGRTDNLLTHVVGNFATMPVMMKRLALVQFFTWSALFIMWIYTTPVVAQYVFGSADPTSAAYNAGGNWVGILFATYNGVAALAAPFLLQPLARRIGQAQTHALALMLGALGFLSFLFLRDARMLLLSEVAIGIAWASTLAMPYAMLASSVPQAKLGIYMGLFNAFVVIPQLLVATVMGTIMRHFFPTEPIWTMAFAAGVMLLASMAALRCRQARS
ncbi:MULTISPECIES: MFS transporter [Sphingobium]|jgi:maltose/moltooligosaccharide transporter|uniref:MFS transporter n=1 Tax=Sphingobium fuliginis (strain ATCC 27551) TaxID=336203 RepID=A0A7M2GDA4_SPHSA|nr:MULTISPECIES: MFS transporter [Sphingobium]QOT70197.1 MFS transporter [Sphingobium fuliginis]